MDPNYLQRIQKYNSFSTSDEDHLDSSDDYKDKSFNNSASLKKGVSTRNSVVGVPNTKRTLVKKDSSTNNKVIKGNFGSNTVLKKQLTKQEKIVTNPD